MNDLGPIRDWHQISVEMLLTDADLALLLFCSIFSGDDQDAVTQVVRRARGIYESILTNRKKVSLSASEAAALEEKLERLRARLKFLGAPVEEIRNRRFLPVGR